MKNKEVVLLSGGLDSATTLAIAKNQGFEVFALSFDYGQRKRVERRKLGLVYSLTHSCYNPKENGSGRGNCNSCQLRLKGFKKTGLKDLIEYTKSDQTKTGIDHTILLYNQRGGSYYRLKFTSIFFCLLPCIGVEFFYFTTSCFIALPSSFK